MQEVKINTKIINLITSRQAWYYKIVPKDSNNSYIDFYTCDKNTDLNRNEELELIFDKEIRFTYIPEDVLLKLLNTYFQQAKANKINKLKKSEYFSDNFVVKIIIEANSLNCSDIHIEIYEERCRIRYRIDGKLVEKYEINKSDYPALINKIKIQANIDIAEKRLPQDGRIFFSDDNENFDIRVSVLPTLFGEKIVLRLLSKNADSLNIEHLGFQKKQLYDYINAIKKPHGIILISGPTGSGKTTTLYSTLKILNKNNVNILTIEDPIEYTLEGINQVQLKENIGLTYPKVLKTFLRQDPDIIMLGEIRDNETAQMAVRAALTGHLVLSTVHTNSAWGIISRLIDMKVPPYLLSETLILSVAQRLIRILCPYCKKKTTRKETDINIPSTINEYYTATGCEHCYYTGYKGRKAVYEVINIDEELSKMIRTHNLKAKEILINKKIIFLKNSALELLKNGETSLEEIQSILNT